MDFAGAQEDAYLDAESLDRLSRYVDELYTKRTFGSVDSEEEDELISLGNMDIETVQSMEKFIRVLSHEDEPLAHELKGIVHQQASIRQETLSSIGNYIHAFSKTNYLNNLVAADDDDDCSTLPGTVILENEHPDMLKSISNYIDYTLATNDLQQTTVHYEKSNDVEVQQKVITEDGGSDDNVSATSSQLAEFQNNDDERMSADEASIENNDTATDVSEDLTAQISPETLSQIGAFIDLVAQRNSKKVLPSNNSNDAPKTESELEDDDVDDVVNTILDDLSMSEQEEILTQLSDDASLTLNANPDLLASVEAYIDHLAKTSAQSATKPDNVNEVTGHLEQLTLDGQTNDDETESELSSRITGAPNELDCSEHDHAAIPSYRMGETHRHRVRYASSDPPANFMSVKSDDDENDTLEMSARPRYGPELSADLVFDTTGEQPVRGEGNNQEFQRRLYSDASGEHDELNDGERYTPANRSRSRRDPELSTDLIFDTTGEKNKLDEIKNNSKKGSQVTEEPDVEAVTMDQAKARTRMGGPELLLTGGRNAKSKTEFLTKDKSRGASTEELVSENSKKENDECMLSTSKRGPPSPEKKNHSKGKHVKVLKEETGSRQIHDVTNAATGKAESPKAILSAEEEEYPSEMEAQLTSDIQNLAVFIKGDKNPSVEDASTVKRFAYFCYPLVCDNEPRAASVSKIMCEADEVGLPLDAADRFLSLAQLALDERRRNIEIEAAPSDEIRSPHLSSASATSADAASQSFQAFVARLVKTGTQNPQFMLLMEAEDAGYDFDDDKAYVDILVNSGSGGEDGADAIEVDLLCGALTSNDRRNGHDHWQTYAAKLLMSDSGNDLDDISSTSSDYVDKPPSRNHSRHRDPPDERDRAVADELVKRPGITPGRTEETFDKHITNFWNEQQKKKKKRFGYPRRTVRSLAESFSNDDNDTLSFITGSHASSFDMMEDAWIIRRSMAMYGKQSGWNESSKLMIANVHPPKPIDAVHTTARFFHRGSFVKRSKVDPLTSVWKEIYADRTAAHPGYLDVHVNSLYAATSCFGERDPRDSQPWENRPVKQCFLHEQSVSFCKNWFGVLVPRHKNQTVHQPVCRPDSFPMPVAAGEWTQEWYTKKNLAPIQSNLSGSIGGPDALEKSDFFPDEESYDESLYDKAPQCGRIRSMKLKIGEKITRVTPDLTSSLRRSRWRKRHFPRGTFPYK